MSKEKDLTIQLLEAKIERITGKKVVYQESKKELIEKLKTRLEKISGKKVAFKENTATPTDEINFIKALAADPVLKAAGSAKAIPTAKKVIAKLQSSVPAADATGTPQGVPGKSPVAPGAPKQSGAMEEEVISMTAVGLGVGAMALVAFLSTTFETWRENKAQKEKIKASILGAAKKSGIQLSDAEIEAEMKKQYVAWQAREKKKKYGKMDTGLGF